jgi:hypothetical protein
MTGTQAQLEAVLKAAHDLLGARQDSMDTIDEWAALARAVAACAGRTTVEYLTKRDIEHVREYGAAWDEATDGPLPADDGD